MIRAVGLAILIIGLLAAAILVTQQQLLKNRAFSPGPITSTKNIFLSPVSGTVSVGETIPIQIKFHTPSAISGLAVKLTLPSDVQVVGNQTYPNPSLSSDWSFPVNTVTSASGTTTLELAAVNLGVAGFNSPADVVLATFTLQFNQLPPSGQVTLTMDPILTQMKTKADDQNVADPNLTTTYLVNDIVITPNPTPTIPANMTNLHLKIRFQGVVTQKPNKDVRITLRKSGQSDQIFNINMQSDTNGVYTYTGSAITISTGIYDILVKGPIHLQKKFPGVDLTTSGILTKDLTLAPLKAGDIGGSGGFFDNTIDGVDYTVLANAFQFGVLQTSIADLNFDGVVDGLDYTILANNFNFGVYGDQ